MRHASVFHYYGAAIVEGIDPIRFLGLMLASITLTVLGAVLFDRRDVLA